MVRLPQINSSYIDKQKYFMLFETKFFDKDNFMSYLFVNPVKIIRADNFSGVARAFKEIEQYSKSFYLAGYFAYELGYYFEKESFRRKKHPGIPLIHLAVFDKRFYFNHKSGRGNMAIPGLFSRDNSKGNFYINNLKLDISPGDYLDKVLKIKDYIRRGDTYQVNFTAKYNFDFSGSPFQLYSELSKRQHVQYGSFCKFGSHYVLSLSPELFLRRQSQDISSQPMKGTMKRGRDAEEDRNNIKKLRASLKDRAENLMIVDLVRNDLGRLSNANTVKVTEHFRIRKYETILQMTSQVNSMLRKKITYFDIFRNTFPGGSVTGAPKIRTMQIIRDLEAAPRGVYCGALGFISKGNKAVFNLPIRTISIIGTKAEMGVGSGIVYDSSPKDELKECMLKAKFLTGRNNDFRLIESIVWDGEFKFFKEHLKRMKSSAEYFGFSYDLKSIINKLRKAEAKLIKGKKYKLRLLSDKSGNLEITYSTVRIWKGVKYIAISRYRVNPDDVFLRHKTTNRALYDREYSHYKGLGYYEVIFINTRGEITEGAASNIIIEKKNRLYTPPISVGLLPGIYRGDLLRRRVIKEKVISLTDLSDADKIFVCNSVRGITQVKLNNLIL